MKNTHKENDEEKWERGELGASEQFVRKVSAHHAKTIDKNLGLQMISIRLQKQIIDELKALARAEGIGYQPYIRQLLTRHIQCKRKGDGTYG